MLGFNNNSTTPSRLSTLFHFNAKGSISKRIIFLPFCNLKYNQNLSNNIAVFKSKQ